MPRPKREFRRLTDDEVEVVENNMGLVGHVIKQRKSRTMEYQDQFQTGYLALVKAAQTFDASMGFTFSTYAVDCINNELHNAARGANQIRIPAYLQGKSGENRKHFPEATKARKMVSVDVLSDSYGAYPVSYEGADSIHEREIKADIHGAIACLSQREQDVVRSVDIQGETSVSVGRRLRIRNATVGYFRMKAHQKLREKLQAYA